jgi:hypothetical protein
VLAALEMAIGQRKPHNVIGLTLPGDGRAWNFRNRSDNDHRRKPDLRRERRTRARGGAMLLSLLFAVMIGSLVIGFILMIVVGFKLSAKLGDADQVDSWYKLSRSQRLRLLDTRAKRTLFRLHSAATFMLALPFLLLGFGWIIVGPALAWSWAEEHVASPWFVVVALVAAYVLHHVQRIAGPFAGLIEMAFGIVVILTFVLHSDEANANTRLLAVLGGVYSLLQGMEKFDKGRTTPSTLEWVGPVGLRVVAIYDLLVNWDIKTWRERKNWTLVRKEDLQEQETTAAEEQLSWPC